ncbi:MAG: hypothetical protein ACO2OR_05540 [Desulfurococcaceae archaeon]
MALHRSGYRALITPRRIVLPGLIGLGQLISHPPALLLRSTRSAVKSSLPSS